MHKKQIRIVLAAVVFGLSLLSSVPLDRSRKPPAAFLPPSPAAYAKEALKAGLVDPKTGKKIKYWAAPMDPAYIRNEPGKSPMGMDLIPVYEEEEGTAKEPTSTIRIDPVTQQNMGLRLGRVARQPLAKSIRTVGIIAFNETGLYAVNTKFNGWIEKLHVDFLGDRVKKGQPLFDIYSPDLLTAQQEYLIAVQQLAAGGKSSATATQIGTRRLLEASRTRLAYWDLTDEQIARLETTGRIHKTLTIYSPAAGVVIQKNAFEGHYVKAGEHQYEIADLSTVWVDVDIYEYELPWVHRGMAAEMALAYIPGRRFFGEVLFIYPYLDPKTRTARLRLAFPNHDRALMPGMYADIYLKNRLPGRRLVIPQEAVIDSGVTKRVFVSRGNGKFEPRTVSLGVEGDDDLFEVLDGLLEGEAIVLSGQFMLDSESRLKEAVAKMLEVGAHRGGHDANMDAAVLKDDLDMQGLTMEGDDMDMSDMGMEASPVPESPAPKE